LDDVVDTSALYAVFDRDGTNHERARRQLFRSVKSIGDSSPRHQAAVEAVLAASHKKLSAVDCASFQTMREKRCAQLFT